MTMFRQLIIAAAAAGLLGATASVANSQGRHSYGYYAPSYGYGYDSGRSDPTNTNGN
jgi:hypothetical protein